MRVYDKEFNKEANKLSYEAGPKAASEQLGIPETTLYTWRNRIKQHGDIAFVGSGHKRVCVDTFTSAAKICVTPENAMTTPEWSPFLPR